MSFLCWIQCGHSFDDQITGKSTQDHNREIVKEKEYSGFIKIEEYKCRLQEHIISKLPFNETKDPIDWNSSRHSHHGKPDLFFLPFESVERHGKMCPGMYTHEHKAPVSKAQMDLPCRCCYTGNPDEGVKIPWHQNSAERLKDHKQQ